MSEGGRFNPHEFREILSPVERPPSLTLRVTYLLPFALLGFSSKNKETDAIGVHVLAAHQRAEQNPACLRIWLDAKAKLKNGPFSCGGRSRNRMRACDYIQHPNALLVASTGVVMDFLSEQSPTGCC